MIHFSNLAGKRRFAVCTAFLSLSTGLLVWSAGASNCHGEELRADERIRIGISDTRQLIGLKVCDNICDGEREKKLTKFPDGLTNSTWLRIDEMEIPFGLRGFEKISGRPRGEQSSLPKKPRLRAEADWSYAPEEIRVVQRVELLVDNEGKLFETCRVRYTLTNLGPKTRRVTLRVVINTCVGENNMCHFVWNDHEKIITTSQDARVGGIAIPDHVDALERDDRKNHGLVARLQIINKEFSETPTRFVITQLPKEKPFEVNPSDIRHSSAVVIYWEKTLARGKSFEASYCYGKGTLAAKKAAK